MATTRGPSPASHADVAARTNASIDAWKRKLLDLTKRNRALNFRPTRVSTVAIVDEEPSEVYRYLVAQELAMRFAAAPERPVAGAAPGRSEQGQLDAVAGHDDGDDDEHEILSREVAPYDPGSLDGRHTDDTLQTGLAPEQLDRALRRLDEQARLAIEEQGVNTLFLALGMLHYVESTDSEQILRAPLVLVPVELTRKSARAGYQLRVTADDPIVNPTLLEYLRPSGITLPELPALDDETADLQAFFRDAAAAVARKARWTVKAEIVLALFSFQKLVMYKDLDENTAALGEHALVRQLITRSGSTGGHVIGLPDEVRHMDLDAEYPPERTFQVVDADSSQLRAIAAVARGHDVVIEGPPGTGKSQTITNLIAQALAAGKSVLFVAEKMAALSVVHSRLVQAGLGEFCLELHSTKANKRAVVRSLGAALDASVQQIASSTASGQRLPAVRATLTEYARAVHAPHGALGAPPYFGYGELGRVAGAPRITYPGPVDSVARDQLDQTTRDLRDLAAAINAVGVPADHPWRDADRTFYTGDELETVRSHAADLSRQLDEVIAGAKQVELGLSLPPVRTFADIETAVAVADVLQRSPGAPLAVLSSDAWNAPPPEAQRLVEQGQAIVALRDRLLGRLSADALEQDHGEDVAYVQRKSEGLFGFLAIVDGRYRAIRRRWISYRTAGFTGSIAEQADLMKQVDRLRRDRAALIAAEPAARALFGGLWQGEQSDWAVLANYMRWVVEFRGVCVEHGLSGRALEVASRAAPDVSDVHALRERARETAAVLTLLRGAVGWPETYLETTPLLEIAARAAALERDYQHGPRWAVFEGARQTVERGIAAALLPSVLGGELAAADIEPAFLRAFWAKWLAGVVRERPPLERFATLVHEERMAEFRRLDQQVFLENRATLIGQLRDTVQHRLRTTDASAGLPLLRREITKQRAHLPLRRTLTQAAAAVRAIKPCWMMSPLTVAQYLDRGAPSFDLVIFDEASQLPVEDAIGAVARGRQLVVVGDPKQLPPTNFFAASTGQVDAELGEDGMPLFEDAESILEEFMGSGMPMSRLRWHYRSAHESLISFSNVSFYDADLHTFPSVDTSTARAGLQFRFVEDGLYEGKGLNLAEARRVADEVVRFAREQLRRHRREDWLSLGVGTFNQRQQLAVQDELEQRRRDDPSIEPFFDRGASEPFFVKNLENIQGDERDVILLSVTYARAADGRLRYNFGPLNGENGGRRLNVLTTRARQRMIVFSSMRGDEINLAATASRGAQLLREFLMYAEHGKLESTIASLSADTDSPFEREVLQELAQRNLTVVPQVGVAGYRIDLGVLDDATLGRFLCGIECDGMAYHASETARDRDRLRQQVLEARGWTIHRVWSTDWFKDRPGQIERLLRLIEETRERTAQERTSTEESEDGSSAEASESVNGDAGDLPTAGAPRAGSDRVYVRPQAAPYRFTPSEGRFAGADILAAPLGQIGAVLREVAASEAPIHVNDVMTRVAGTWGNRAGVRIQGRILEASRAAERQGLVRWRGDFLWGEQDDVTVRTRAHTRIGGERIAAEEYAAAIRMVLAGGHSFSRPQLVAEVRAVFGFARTGAVLEEAIGRVIDSLLASGELGEASTGICLRNV